MEVADLRTVRVKNGGYERRSAERYESHLESAIKDVQRDVVADWLIRHHRPGERMRLLSFPDRYWTFENRMNERPGTTFVGLQRDWKTLELSAPWIPMLDSRPTWADENRVHHFHTRVVTGDVQGYRRGDNVVFHMWAGHLLSWDNLDRHRSQGRRRRRAYGFRPGKTFRRSTAAWLDFTGYLTDEVVTATSGVPIFLGGGREVFPVVVTFLACRDGFHDHDERVAHLLIALQRGQRRGSGWRFRFDRYEVHVGTSPFVSVFGDYRFVREIQPAVASLPSRPGPIVEPAQKSSETRRDEP